MTGTPDIEVMVDGPNEVFWDTGTAAPTSGLYGLGQIIWNSQPAPGEPAGWECVAAGNPGTWNALANLPLVATVTYDPASLATTVQDTIQSITVTGAVVGNKATATFSNDLVGVSLTAWVSAANTVKFVFTNQTSGTVNLASGTVKVTVTP